MLTIRSPRQGRSDDVIVPVFQKSNHQTRKRSTFKAEGQTLCLGKGLGGLPHKRKGRMLTSIICYEPGLRSVLGLENLGAL